MLGVSTSTARIGVAVGDDDGIRATWGAVQPRRHAEMIPPAIQEVCRAAEVDLGAIDAVAVDNGPGLFTGLRVGVATAKALAFALGVPIVAVSSLDLLAFASRHASKRVTATIDARRSEVFTASYIAVPGGTQRVVEPHAASPDDLAAELEADPSPHLVVGNGAQRYAERFARNDRVTLAEVEFPSAEALVRLAHAKARRGETVDPASVACTYLREPDAAINWQTRDGQVGGISHRTP